MDIVKKLRKNNTKAVTVQKLKEDNGFKHQDPGTKTGIFHAAILLSENDILIELLEIIKKEYESNYLEILELKDAQKRTCLMLAIQTENEACLDALLEHNVDVNSVEKNFSALQLAAKTNRVSIIRKLLKKGADLNYRNIHGGALTIAISDGNEETVEEFLEMPNLDLEITDKDGNNY